MRLAPSERRIEAESSVQERSARRSERGAAIAAVGGRSRAWPAAWRRRGRAELRNSQPSQVETSGRRKILRNFPSRRHGASATSAERTTCRGRHSPKLSKFSIAAARRLRAPTNCRRRRLRPRSEVVNARIASTAPNISTIRRPHRAERSRDRKTRKRSVVRRIPSADDALPAARNVAETLKIDDSRRPPRRGSEIRTTARGASKRETAILTKFHVVAT